MEIMKNNKHTFVDLFAGCGGLSEGFLKSGFNGLCHVDFDKYACNTLANRLKDYNIQDKEIKKGRILLLWRLEDILNKSVFDYLIQEPEAFGL